jgi:hypothetical protein
MATCDLFSLSKYGDFCSFFFPKKAFVQFAMGFFPCRDSAKIRHPKKKKKNCLGPGLFLPEFCDAAEVAIIHNII